MATALNKFSTHFPSPTIIFFLKSCSITQIRHVTATRSGSACGEEGAQFICGPYTTHSAELKSLILDARELGLDVLREWISDNIDME